MEKRLSAMLAIYTGKGVTPEVNLRDYRSISYMPPPSLNKAGHYGFETQRRHHQKSETGVSVSQKWTYVQQKLKKNKEFYESKTR